MVSVAFDAGGNLWVASADDSLVLELAETAALKTDGLDRYWFEGSADAPGTPLALEYRPYDYRRTFLVPRSVDGSKMGTERAFLPSWSNPCLTR